MWRNVSKIVCVVYALFLVKVVVFKSFSVIGTGQLRLNFAGLETTGSVNLVPFRTISLYVFGNANSVIAGVNLAGNIVVFIPMGFFLFFAISRLVWHRALLAGIMIGLSIETLQFVLRVGVFDIDDAFLMHWV